MQNSMKTCLLRHVTLLDSIYVTGCCVVPVRWRKLRHLPRAPSKFFVVREPTIVPPDEQQFLKENYPIYKTKTKAIAALFKAQLAEKGVGGQDDLDRIKQEEEDHQEMMRLNDKWNQQVAKQREIRVAMEILEHRRAAKVAIARNTKKSLEDLERVEEEIQYVKERSKDFINLDNLDSKIEELLDSRVDFNYAIDKDGNKIYPDEELDSHQKHENEKQTENVTGS